MEIKSFPIVLRVKNMQDAEGRRIQMLRMHSMQDVAGLDMKEQVFLRRMCVCLAAALAAIPL